MIEVILAYREGFPVPFGEMDIVQNSPERRRLPRARHKAEVIRFLQRVAVATRQEIVASTGIPSGSLSEILRNGKEFKRTSHGVWMLR